MKIISVFGTRPDAIKMAPVVKELEKCPLLESKVVVTGQHRELLDQVLSVFSIAPDYQLKIMSKGQSLAQITGRVMEELDPILQEEKPKVVLVQGDTSTSFTAALSAFYRRIKLAHVEAGLRTFEKFHPFPEELNRRLITPLADIHFAPTLEARENLLREGVSPDRIFLTGNTAIDAMFQVQKMQDYLKKSKIANQTRDLKLVLVTIHRRESWGTPLLEVCEALKVLISRHSDIEIVFPVHPNPSVKEAVLKCLGQVPRVALVPPYPYSEFVQLIQRAYLILTDSGGIQEEAAALGKPVLVLRDVTERRESLRAGISKVIGTRKENIIDSVSSLLTDNEAYQSMARVVDLYGDGKAAERIVSGLLYCFHLQQDAPADFVPASAKGFHQRENGNLVSE